MSLPSRVESSSTQDRLGRPAVATFRRNGYLVFPEPVLAPPQFDALRRTFEDLLAALPEGARPEDMDVPHFTHPELLSFACDPRVLGLVEPILGPDLALFSTHFICKPAGDGKRVPWHQDSFYWRHMLEPMDVVTVWLAIDPSTKDNGAMRVIPGSHTSGDSVYDTTDTRVNTFPMEVRKGYFNEAAAVTLELAPNHASLHTAQILHGSDSNVSSRRRCGYTMRFISTRSHFDHERCDYHQLYLVQGRDLGRNVYADPARAYPELLARRARRVRRGH